MKESMSESPPGVQAAKSERTRRSILDSATDVAKREGVGNITLGRVAENAGISKGGLLHHFGSKQALIVALLTDTLEQADADLNDLAQANKRTSGAFTQAYLDFVRTGQHTNGTATGVFAAAALEDGDLGPARTMFNQWQKRLVNSDGVDQDTAILARVIGDGLWLIDLFDLAPPSPAQRERLFRIVEERL